MVLTIDSLLSTPGIITAVIHRMIATMTEADKIHWKDYLEYKQANPDGTFKTFIGNQTGVIIGSFIDRFSNKPVRKRRALARGYGEVGCLGDSYQMDNQRLEELNILIETFNRTQSQETINDIVNFLVDDFRQCYLAPHKRLDLMLADLRFNGSAKVNAKADQNGVKLDEIKLPILTVKAAVGDKSNIITWIRQNFTEGLTAKGYSFSLMEMNLNTFNKRIAASDEFKNTYTLTFGNTKVNPVNIITPDMANTLLTGIGMPPIRIKNEYIQLQDGSTLNAVPDDKISLIPSGKLGFMRYKRPYEMIDKVPGKNYTEVEDGRIFISTQRTDEGRFMEYGGELIPDINIPNRMAIADLTALG